MNEAIRGVRSGQVTFAVRDTSIDGIEIKEGHFIGIEDGKIVVSEPELVEASRKLLDHMIREAEIVTILTGEDAGDEQTEQLTAYIEAQYPNVEIELHPGGQPLYAYIFSVE